MQDIADDLSHSRDKKECLRKAYEILASRYRGHRFKTYFYFSRLFLENIGAMWEKKGFLYCMDLNHILKVLLVKSGFFKEEDIRPKWTMIWFISPHQYVAVDVGGGETIFVDIWGKIYGIPYGEYAHGARSGSLRAKE